MRISRISRTDEENGDVDSVSIAFRPHKISRDLIEGLMRVFRGYIDETLLYHITSAPTQDLKSRTILRVLPYEDTIVRFVLLCEKKLTNSSHF